MKKLAITSNQKEALEKQAAALLVASVLSVVTVAAASVANALTEVKVVANDPQSNA